MRIEVKGPIINDSDQWVYDWFGITATSPGKINNLIDRAVKNNDNEIVVLINSGGGSVFDASEIYTALKSYSGKVITRIVGVAASAASVVASAGYCEMAPTAQLMIHNATNGKEGDYRDMNANSDFLQKVNLSIMNAYTSKTGKTIDELKNLVDSETWMTAQEAKEHGFVDAIMFENEQAAVASAESPHLVNGMLPPEVIEKVRNEILKDKSFKVFNNAADKTPAEPAKNKNKGDEAVMNLETLQNDHPELFEKVKAIGFEEGLKAENTRIKNIEDIAMPGNEELVNKAKFETKMTAEQLAVQIIKNDKEKAVNHFKNVQADAQQLKNVGDTQTIPTDVDNEAATVAEFNNIWGGK